MRVARSIRFVLGALALLYLAALACYFGASALGMARVGLLALIRELTLYLFLPLLFLLVPALLLRARVATVLLVPPLAYFAYSYGPQLLPRSAPPVTGPSFRLLSFTVGGNTGGGQPEPVLSALRAIDADLIALQEVPSASLAALRDALAADYPYQAGTPEAATFSRFPLYESRDLELQFGPYRGQLVDVEVGDRVLTLANIHTTRPIRWPGWTRGRLLPLVRGYDPVWRDDLVAALLGYLRTLPGPLLLTGDFSDTEWSAPYQLVAAELLDSFREAGWGFGHTYPSNIAMGAWRVSLPLVRIDYVFHSAELVALRARVGPYGGSDHLPVVAELAFR